MIHASQAVVWFVSAVLVEAAIIDGLKLRVPNWLTYHFALGGLACATWMGGSPCVASRSPHSATPGAAATTRCRGTMRKGRTRAGSETSA